MRLNLNNPFTKHPNSVGESYIQHLRVAGGFSFRLAIASLACLMHALLPFLFVKTGSRLIDQLHDEMVKNRNAQDNSIA